MHAYVNAAEQSKDYESCWELGAGEHIAWTSLANAVWEDQLQLLVHAQLPACTSSPMAFAPFGSNKKMLAG